MKHGATATSGTAPSTSTTTSAATATSSTTATSSITATASSTAAKGDSIKKGRFQVLLQQFLQQHYSPEDMAKLMEQLDKVIVIVVLMTTYIQIHYRVYMT